MTDDAEEDIPFIFNAPLTIFLAWGKNDIIEKYTNYKTLEI